MSKRFIVLTAVSFFIIAILQSFPAYCQDESALIVKTIDGRVVSVDPQNSQVTVKTVENITFFVPTGAKVTNKNGFDIQLSDIDAGNYVMVEYYDDHSGKHIARNINVEYAD